MVHVDILALVSLCVFAVSVLRYTSYLEVLIAVANFKFSSCLAKVHVLSFKLPCSSDLCVFLHIDSIIFEVSDF